MKATTDRSDFFFDYYNLLIIYLTLLYYIQWYLHDKIVFSVIECILRAKKKKFVIVCDRWIMCDGKRPYSILSWFLSTLVQKQM